jgi:hypothetical protein
MTNRSIDAYYTPGPVAATLAAVLTNGQRSVGRTADFAVGPGVLLDELAKVDPGGEWHGTDVDNRVVRKLRLKRPAWQVGKCNFLDEGAHRRCAITKPGKPFDTIALNPPYSYRGGEVTQIKLDGSWIRCSPAASFIGLASRYTHHDSWMAALIPKGSLTAERDAEFWRAMRRAWRFSVVEELPRGWVTGTHAAAVILHLERRRIEVEEQETDDDGGECPSLRVRLVRGCTPMHKVKRARAGSLMLHTTSLTRGGPAPFRARAPKGRSIAAPAVLLPRVGQPVDWKVQKYESQMPSTLSDCVIGLQCETPLEAERVYSLIANNWRALKGAWGGSCAPYVTMKRLRLALAGVGIEVMEDG